MAWCIWGGGCGDNGALYVGEARHAEGWAFHFADAVVNCAQHDFPYQLKDPKQHRWLHIQERSWFNGRNWFQRMRSVMHWVLIHLAAGHSVLLHCWAGKHRSGVFGVLLIALLQGIKWSKALEWYFRTRPLPQGWDQSKVRRLGQRHNMEALLETLRSEGFCHELLRVMPRPTAQTKKRPTAQPVLSSSSLSSSGVPENAPGVLSKASTTLSSSGVLRKPPLEKKGPALNSWPKAKAFAPPKRIGIPPQNKFQGRGSVQQQLQPNTPAMAPPPRRVVLKPRPPQVPPPRVILRPPPTSRPEQPQPPPQPVQPPLKKRRVEGKPSPSQLLCVKTSIPQRSMTSSNSGVPGKSPSPQLQSRRRSLSCSRSPSISRSPSRSRSRSRSRGRSRSASPPLRDDQVWQCPGCEGLNPRGMMKCRGCERHVPLLQKWSEGDWFCQVCGNHNFACRMVCNNTHCPTMKFKPGDWICGSCSNHNYAKNQICNTRWCQRPKPSR